MVRREYKNNPVLNGSDDGFQEALRIFLEGRNRRPGGSPLHQTLRHILFWLKTSISSRQLICTTSCPLQSHHGYYPIVYWIPTSPYFNSQVSSWFCKTNDRLICPYPLLNMVVFENCFTGLLLKFYFRPFDDIRSNRKWNLLSTVNRKSQPETLFLVGHWRLEGMRNDLTKSFRPYRLSISHNQYP